MKGLAVSVAGIAILLVSLVILGIIINGQGPSQVNIIFVGDLAYSAAHQVALYRQIVPVSAEFIALNAADDIGQLRAMWDTTGPTVLSIRTELENRIHDGMPSGPYEVDAKERKISFAEPSITVKDYASGSCGSTVGTVIVSQCFNLSGSQQFTITDSRLRGTIQSSVPLKQNVKTAFFTLVSIGRNILDGGYWIIDQDLTTKKGAGSMTFGVKNTNNDRCRSLTGISNAWGSHIFWEINSIKDLPSHALICGFGPAPGLSTLTDWTSGKATADNIAVEINDWLDLHYRDVDPMTDPIRTRVTVDKYTGSSDGFSVILLWNITDTETTRYVGNRPLSLLFRTETKWP